ncbi:MAG: hypothetical protein J5985_01820 [Kiritimatiellae bacterium]|nr:hypothetical protein [Kiritimatiellia bacterium]
MNDNHRKETESDDLDTTIAAALRDPSAWPIPHADFEERCTARVAELLKEDRKMHPFRSFVKSPFLKIAAVLAVTMSLSSIVFNTVLDTMEPDNTETTVYSGPATTDAGSRCERMVKLLEKEVSRKAATKYLANVCMANSI